MSRRVDMAGQTFGRWTVIELADNGRNGAARWHCVCSCGTARIVCGSRLRRGRGGSRSCGCEQREQLTTHGCSRQGTREYLSWLAAKARCKNPKYHAYSHYGGRGIVMCERWRDDFAAFLADMGPCPPGYSLDRKDYDGNYEPDNCRWATAKEQGRNMRSNRRITFNDETLCAVEWDERLGFRSGTVRDRLGQGWTIERALTEPPRKFVSGHYMKAAAV